MGKITRVLTGVAAALVLAGCGSSSGQGVTVTVTAAAEPPSTVTVTAAPSEATSAPSVATSAGGSTQQASGDLGTRTAPLAVGTQVTLGGEWLVSVGATEFRDGLAILPMTAAYVGTKTGQPALVSAKFVGGKGNSFDGMTSSCSYPAYDSGTSISLQGEVYPGATATGTKCIEVPAEQVDGGVWSVTAGFNFDEAFFATA